MTTIDTLDMRKQGEEKYNAVTGKLWTSIMTLGFCREKEVFSIIIIFYLL